jgi:ectoine hydroxylase-related dioxygenase (phytanoyl-CoA dioxygenase family)
MLPRLDDPHPLARETIKDFRRDGHVCVRALASADEVAAYRPLIDAATMAHRYDKRPLEERETYGKAFVQSPNLWRRESPIAGFTLAKRFARAAAELMGVDGVRLYHDQALYKEPGGGFTPWHQDQTYWPLDTTHTITLWMPLVDIPPSVGSMRFASGSHAFGNLGFEGIGDDSQEYFEDLIAKRGFEVSTHGALRAGDATFHAGWTIHGAAGNPSTAMRSVMTIIYFADGVRVARPTDFQRGDLKYWLADLPPGELANGPKNPLLWSRNASELADPLIGD